MDLKNGAGLPLKEIDPMENANDGDDSPNSPNDAEMVIVPNSDVRLTAMTTPPTNIDELLIGKSKQERHEFLMDPLPPGTFFHCKVTREKKKFGTARIVFETDSGIFLAAAKKKGGAVGSAGYIICSHATDLDRDGPHYLGKIKSNFSGTEFVGFDAGKNLAKKGFMSPRKELLSPKSKATSNDREEMIAVRYKSGKGPRDLCIVLPLVDDGERSPCKPIRRQDGLLALGDDHDSTVATYRNRKPILDREYNCYYLNFGPRVQLASVKNFQLVRTNAGNDDTTYVQFGRMTDRTFSLDFCHPVSPFQAFSMALTSLDFKFRVA